MSEAGTLPHNNSDEKLRRQLRTIERAGWALFVVWAVTLIAWGFIQPNPYAQGWRLVLELAFAGRLLSVSDGVTSGFSTAYLLVQNLPQDLILFLVVYPWVVRGHKFGLKQNAIGRQIDSLRRSAERHKKVVAPFGVLGLWAFIFFPFWSTGSLVGGVLGYVLGMRFPALFSTILLGHCLSVFAILWFFEWMHSLAESIDAGLTKYIPWVVVVVILSMFFVVKALDTFGNKTAENDADS